MIILVCGSRTWSDHGIIFDKLESLPSDADEDVLIIHGGASGADTIAASIAMGLGYGHRAYPADWNTHGKGAGPIRNQRMLDEGTPDIVLAFWDGESRGTLDMITRARRAGIPVEIIGP